MTNKMFCFQCEQTAGVPAVPETPGYAAKGPKRLNFRTS